MHLPSCCYLSPHVPYRYEEARTVFMEMVDALCGDMFLKNLTAASFTWWVSYDYKSLEAVPDYNGELSLDFYGRLHPAHSNGTVRLRDRTNSSLIIGPAVLFQFDRKTDHRLLYRRLGLAANDVQRTSGEYQLDLFSDYDALEKENSLRAAMLSVRNKYGLNAVFRGTSLQDGATALERNECIGGHKA